MDAEVIDLDEDHLVGSYSALLVAIWGPKVPQEKVAKFILQVKDFLERWPRFAFLVLVDPDDEIPNKEARKKLEELVILVLPKCLGVVFVFEGKGFRATVIRTMMTALMFIPPNIKQHKIARSVDEGLDWLVPILAGPEFGNEAERRKAVKSLQQRFNDYRSRGAPAHDLRP